MADIRRLSRCKSYERIDTVIGGLSICGISGKDRRALDDLLRARSEPCTPEQFVRELALLTCYPPGALEDGSYRPDAPCLSGDEVSQLSSDDLERIASVFVEHEQYLSRKLVRNGAESREGKSVCTSEYSEIEHPREPGESSVHYLHRLWIVYSDTRKKAHERIVARAMPRSPFSSYFRDSVGGNLRLGNSLRRSMEEAMGCADILAGMEQQRRLLDQIGRPSRLLEDIRKDAAWMRALGESITAPCRAIHDTMRSQLAVFEGLSARVATLNSVGLSIRQFEQATLAWNVASVGLASRMKDIGLSVQRELLSARLLQVPKTYTAFLQHTTERLAADPTRDVAACLRASLNLAGQQMLSISDALCGLVAVPDDDEEPDQIGVLNAPFAQQDELLGCHAVEDENDTGAMTGNSATAQTVQLARCVLELVTQCNEAGKTSGSCGEIFKPTTRLMTVFSDLPWIAATDRSRFFEVVDCLYFIFYEGAGNDNLRFLDRHGGPLTDADCDLVWCIKHLRNKWSRHDADHGKEKDIQKSWEEVAAKFRWLGLAQYPSDSCHFRHLQQQLLVEAENFLRRILNRLKLKQ